ncbi:hypothetical protein ACHOLT_18205 [Desulfitobacterium sp. Sab5]|uniref:hypothetical protein n=1 Tax=Desulfitobacterium nosdiversum TaxID=3375356 RepID=UPI003CF32326
MALKKYRFKAIILILLFAFGLMSGYSLWNYHGSTVSQSQITQQIRGKGVNQPGAQNSANTPGISSGTDERGQAIAGGSPQGKMRNFNNGISSGNQLTFPILAYALIFFTTVLIAYYVFAYKKIKLSIPSDKHKLLIFTILCIGLLWRISLATWVTGHPYDLSTFLNWANTAANRFSQFYTGLSTGRSASDYPPLYIYVLYLIGKAISISWLSPYAVLLLKLPSILADILTGYLIYKLAEKHLTWEKSALLSAFYLFNPAIFINSTVWGQVDSFFTLIIVTAVILLTEQKIGLAAVFFTAAILMKPQGIIFIPVLGFELIRQLKQKNWKIVFKAILAAMLTTVILVLPFSINGGVSWILKLYTGTLGEYPYASVNGFNLYSLFGLNFVKDTAKGFIFSYHQWGLIFIVLISAFAWFLYIKGKDASYVAATAWLLIAGVFVLSTRMHERYLFPAVALGVLAFIYLKDKRFLLLTTGFSLTVYANTHYVLFETLKGINTVPFNSVLFLTSLLNVLVLGYLIKVIYDIAVKGRTIR